ncbi:hypothetical protein K493DRAFT_346321 [Basidiobolus meristosporus CBS 931.73]|uniref:Uncharacterized protein n=1 Tax=Basidiobolus meristosporus CBS 931.73 TaxID=1314790 RepID=A0A1Y1YYU8_9FUNG|nr:hypothetical protein K493DRAFT_346321 [Basidiobolus meristosporus CBS 931.73]|eukprot:ORY03202.1 hypothetical protein K493DRAFT_346321 [Basidiobolus meristosporus CBS 931.73]
MLKYAKISDNPKYTPRADEMEAEMDKAYREFLGYYSDEGRSNAGEYLSEKPECVIRNNPELEKNFAPLTFIGDPHVLGDIEVYDIYCQHREMDRPKSIAEIGRI